ncbi:Phosphate-specific outer membrane porin OprP; Pyrophosphate-specific outer membrane porin OprO [hydrothermal vent metagenome]|uniref:Phosphate-specific outer membrane porin OprP Pyrophosphate-specific outer membrane porin OprO n=1 Tax=hydrothermal vent metagenome TaxID=652676 RepID=A0A3B1C153_9ZZZZ
MKKDLSPLGLSLLLVSAASSSFAGSQPVSLEEMQAQINQLQQQLLEIQTQMVAQQKEAKSAPSNLNDVKISFKPGPKIESADGEYSMQIGGRVKFDATFFDDDKADHSDGTEIRSARLFVAGKLGKDWSYKFQNEFIGKSGDTPATYDSKIKSAYIAYTGIDYVKIIMGQTKQPFGLEYQTSSRFTTFLERASLTALSPGYGIGLGVSTYGKNWTFMGGLYGEDVSYSGDSDEGYSVTARATYAPITGKTEALHFGISGSYREPGSDSDPVTFKSKAETHQASQYSVKTDKMKGVDDYSLLAFESAWVYGPFSMQGEYTIADVNRGSASDPTFDGYYGQVSYFLTGESLNYLGKYGKFGRITPKSRFSLGSGGLGAWEIAARYSNLDLNDGDITGGEMENWTFALNWYPTPYFRLMANYIVVDTDSDAYPTPNDAPDIFALRTQVDF